MIQSGSRAETKVAEQKALCVIDGRSDCIWAVRQPNRRTMCRYRSAGCKNTLQKRTVVFGGRGAECMRCRHEVPNLISLCTPVAVCLLCRHGQSRSPRKAKHLNHSPPGRQNIPFYQIQIVQHTKTVPAEISAGTVTVFAVWFSWKRYRGRRRHPRAYSCAVRHPPAPWGAWTAADAWS